MREAQTGPSMPESWPHWRIEGIRLRVACAHVLLDRHPEAYWNIHNKHDDETGAMS